MCHRRSFKLHPSTMTTRTEKNVGEDLGQRLLPYFYDPLQGRFELTAPFCFRDHLGPRANLIVHGVFTSISLTISALRVSLLSFSKPRSDGQIMLYARVHRRYAPPRGTHHPLLIRQVAALTIPAGRANTPSGHKARSASLRVLTPYFSSQCLIIANPAICHTARLLCTTTSAGELVFWDCIPASYSHPTCDWRTAHRMPG